MEQAETGFRREGNDHNEALRQERQYLRSLIWTVVHRHAFVLTLWGGFLFVEFALLQLAGWTLMHGVGHNKTVEAWFENAEIGLVLITVIGVFLHGLAAIYEVAKEEWGHVRGRSRSPSEKKR